MNRESTQDVPHRKNAAEWMMWIVLQPVRWVCALFVRRP